MHYAVRWKIQLQCAQKLINLQIKCFTSLYHYKKYTPARKLLLNKCITPCLGDVYKNVLNLHNV